MRRGKRQSVLARGESSTDTQTLDERHPGFQISGATKAKHLLNLLCTPCTKNADGPMENFDSPSFSLNGRMEGVLGLGLHLCGQVPPYLKEFSPGCADDLSSGGQE
jgi:hypothetical protein